MDREAWWAAIHRITESDSTEVTLHACTHHEFLKTVLLTRAFLIAQLITSLPAVQETRVQSLGQEDPLEKEMATHSSILVWKIPSQRSLLGCNSWCHKELGMTERLTRQ